MNWHLDPSEVSSGWTGSSGGGARLHGARLGTLTVFHGTGHYCLDSIRNNGPEFHNRCYVTTKCFCTTTDYAVACLFATRKTSADDFSKGLITGVVLEYVLTDAEEGWDFLPVRDPRCTLDEKEVAIFRANKLNLVAIWRYEDNQWVRYPEEQDNG